MKVGLVCAYAFDVPGGVQRQVAELVGRLADVGVGAAVLAPGPGVELAELGGPAGRRSTGAGRAVGMRGNGSVARVGPAAWTGPAYRRWVRDGGFDVVHVHEPLAPGLPQVALGAAAGGPPVVATVHATLGTPIAAAALRLAAPVLRRRLRRAAAVTAVSATAADTVRRLLTSPVMVIGNGVGPGRPCDRPQDRLHDRPDGWPHDRPHDWPHDRPPDRRPPTAVAVGRLDEPRKGIDVLLACWPDVTRRVPGARLLLVGPGRPRGATGGRLPAGVEVLGRVDEAERAAALAAADVAVAPHRGGESFGLVVAEAMADGLPVVASRLPAFAALLEGEGPGGERLRGGVLVPPGDPWALAGALVELLVDPAVRRACGADGRRLVARHSWPLVTARYLEVYRSVLPS